MSGSTRAITLRLSVAEAEQTINALRQAGTVGEEALKKLDAAAQRTAGAQGGMRQLAEANERAGASVGNLRGQLQNASFQLQDFVGQIQAGTSATQAAAQQLPQLLGGFGAIGAAAGVAAALIIPLGAALLGFGKEASEAEKKQAALNEEMRKVPAERFAAAMDVAKGAIGQFNALLETATARQRRLFDEAAQNALRSTGSIRAAAVVDLEGLRQRATGLAEDAGAATERQRLFPGDDRVTRRQLQEIGQELARNLAEQRRLQQTIDDLNRQEGIINARRNLGGQFEPPTGEVPPTTVTGAREGPRPAARLGEQFGPGADEFRASQRLIREQEEASQRAQAALARFEQTSVDAWARIGENAFDRIGSGLVNAFTAGSGAAVNFGNIARAALASVATDVVRGGVAAPLSNAIFGGNRPTLFGGTSSGRGGSLDLSQIFSLGRTGFNAFNSGLTNAVDLGAIGFLQGGSIAGFLNTPIFGAAAQAAATNSALGGLGAGVFGPATPSAVVAAGGSATGALTVGTALGGLGLGFGAGSLVGQLVSNSRGTVGPGGTIGAGVGSLAGLGIGTLLGGPVVGALIGGLIGGAGGGLFGPTRKGLAERSGGAVYFAPDPTGALVITGAAGKRWDEAGMRAEVGEQLTALNNATSARGLFFGMDGFDQLSIGQVGSGQAALRAGAPSELNLAGIAGLIRSFNPNRQQAVNATIARGGDLDAILSAVDFVNQVYEPLGRVAERTSQFEREMRALVQPFDEAIARARELGLSESDLAARRAEAAAELNTARDRQLSAFDSNVNVRRLRARGQSEAADLAQFDANAAAELEQARTLFRDLWLEGAQSTAERLAALESTLAEERLAIQKSYADRALDGERRLAEEQSRIAEERRLAEERSRNETARGVFETLSFGAGSALSPQAQGFAALSALNAARRGVGSAEGLSEFARVAQATLPTIREVFGTTERYGQIVADVAGTLRAGAPGADVAGLAALLEAQASGADATAQAILSVGAGTNDLLSRILAELAQQRGQVEALLRRAA